MRFDASNALLALERDHGDMAGMEKTSLIFFDEMETAAFGAALAPLLGAGDVLLLEGGLGAGKSTLARGLIKAFSDARDVPSPTYTLVETYEGAPAALSHFDLYRLEKADDVWELGFEEVLDDGIALIEWPDRIEGLLPDESLRIRLSIKDDHTRHAEIVMTENWRSRLALADIV